jgi:hypothetical protein
MRKLPLLALTLVLVTLSLMPVPLSQAQTCSCPWEVVQLSDTQSPGSASDCPLLHNNNQRNAGFWADNRCVGRGNACTFVYTPISCTENPDGSVTASGPLKYKCNQC